MKVKQIPFKKTGFFSKTMLDYLERKEKITPFYHNFPDFDGFQKQLQEKKASFTVATRNVLVEALKNQYQLDSVHQISERTQKNIDSLQQENTFTITTGHQLNLFTGPLYFLYKIISTINLCEELSDKFPRENFVPIYWMATEDHDFEEINYFNFDGKKVQWNRKDGGAVGQFSTEGLDAVFAVFSGQLPNSKNAAFIRKLFSEAYLKHNNLAAATCFVANELFGEYGLVILDGADKKLKNLFVPYLKDELQNQTSYQEVSKTIDALEKEYPIQVNPREINLFYLSENSRERIVLDHETYKVKDTKISWTKSEILEEVTNFPEKFSPNVMMRPLYQEVILPNLCYIGGGGEMAYWLELKAYFNALKVPFPILLLRNSVQIISEKQQRKLNVLNISSQEIFLKQHELIAKKVIENSAITADFASKRAFLQQQFAELKLVAKKTDHSFIGAVNAQERKQLKGLESLEKRLLKAEKRRQNDLVERIVEIQNEILPNQSLEERQRNFAEYYLAYGSSFLDVLKAELKPLQLTFTIIEL
jgi:bacillithiol biosynthesis cysteine-adding enzyme BshC